MADEVTTSGELRNRRGHFARARTLSQYAVSLPSQPEDLSGVHPNDDRFTFFEKGRDFQSSKSKHHYTEDELKVLATYESADVHPSHSEVYRQWLDSLPPRRDMETWLIIAIIGLTIGVISFVIKEICEKLQLFNNPFIGDYVERGESYRLWMYYAAMTCTLACLSSLICVYCWPFAAGSGIPELIGILNGAVVRNMLSYKTLWYKFLSTIFTVLSSLPVGFEGPMISIGAMVAAAMARPSDPRCTCCTRSSIQPDQQPNQKSSGFKLCRYRDCKERHNLICMGAAAGVAAAFQSPITGLLFAMEEFSSFWSKTLTWQTFVCCILARSITELLRSCVASLSIRHHAGRKEVPLFEFTESALFDMKEDVRLNLIIVVPTVILGIIGGLVGALFIFIHLKSARIRRKLLAKLKRPEVLNLLKVVEPVLVAFLCSMIMMGSLNLFECHSLNYTSVAVSPHEGKFLRFHHFQCEKPVKINFPPGYVVQTGEFHEFATLIFGSWEQMIRNLLSRKTANIFTMQSCAILLAFFFIFSNWSALCSIANGLLVPQLAIGALYGRLFGRLLCEIFDKLELTDDEVEKWEWMDPGVFALLGAASFLAGTSRLPVTSVVILIEMTNDINLSLLIMIVVMLSKFVGGLFTHPLYHSMLEFKCIPYLDSDISVYDKGKRINLELFRAADIMVSPVRCVNVHESVQVLANLLLDTNHGGFPVVQSGFGFRRTFLGIISRMELIILLTKTRNFNTRELRAEDMDRIRISYPDYSSTKLEDADISNEILNKYADDIRYKTMTVNLLPYMSTSTFCVPSQFSLLRTYLLFRSMGARHLVVADMHNQVLGIITKKDLMQFNVDEKVKALNRSRGSQRLDFSPQTAKDVKYLYKKENGINEEEEDPEDSNDNRQRKTPEQGTASAKNKSPVETTPLLHRGHGPHHENV